MSRLIMKLFAVLAIAACNPDNKEPEKPDTTETTEENNQSKDNGSDKENDGKDQNDNSNQNGNDNTDPSNSQNEENEMKNVISINVNGSMLKATLVANSSTAALQELLKKGPVTIDMSDYGGFEKVGQLPQSLPTNDESITTQAGDLILYLGRSFVIYYDTNSYRFTRLGRIDNTPQSELKKILGSGNVSVTISLP